MEEAGTPRGRLVFAGIGTVFAVLLALYFVYQTRAIALVFLLTLLFSIIISGPVDYLHRKGVGRGLGTFIVLGGLALTLAAAVYGLVPLVEDQARQFVESLPSLLEGTQTLIGQVQSSLGLQTDLRPAPQQILSQAQSFFSGGTLSTFVSFGASVVNVLSLAVVVFLGTIYVVARPMPLVNGFVAFFPAGKREKVREVLYKLYSTVQRWFIGQLTDMFIVGVLFAITLAVIGVPFALLFGVLSGLLAFIPYIGPVISVIPPVLLALSQDPLLAVWVLLAYVAVQAIESNIIQPIVMSRAVSLHPAVVVFALLIMGTLFGFVGVLLAVPLVAAVQVLVQELWIRRMDERGTDPNPPPEEPVRRKQRAGLLKRAAATLFRRS